MGFWDTRARTTQATVLGLQTSVFVCSENIRVGIITTQGLLCLPGNTVQIKASCFFF